MDLVDSLIGVLTGMTPDQLHEEGGQVYPEENNAGNQGGHRLSAALTTSRLSPFIGPVAAPIATQALGVGNEIFEAANKAAVGGSGQFTPAWARDTLDDLGANLRGTADASPITQALLALAPEALRSLLQPRGTTPAR